MTAYAIAHIREITMGPDIVEYLERIDATLAPYGGRFLVHGADVRTLEGEWPGDIVIIAFPDHDHATRWYESDPYQAILPLRTENSDSVAILVDGVGDDHRATDILGRAGATGTPLPAEQI
ncbi:DUF1330 domain-containing protein [Mumia sp. zg.B53]|uniref:DUF1330 domain-containing protein n=1 Tax=unclassified Mumia TaxID=2621872 RepID=UPI001C6ED148|nr:MULTISPECIES: DUF1330 domain-containing protein [unclassified Mumia]MBW9205394.1 DUF1330 domain-containing protein [Mumia sp. zg.B17]MBW9216563.1 DUF1330 domain-containing protein [Mumia sp. zg.B53]MDD9348311.1 DUF1330 domain-containing protein [Mumia sp.]